MLRRSFVLRAVLLSVAFLGAFWLCDRAFGLAGPLQAGTAEACAWLLRLFGVGHERLGTKILTGSGTRFHVTLQCTGVVSGLVSLGIIWAVGAPFLHRVIATPLGMGFWFVMNQARIVSVIMSDGAGHEARDLAHEVVWPILTGVVFVVAVMLFRDWHLRAIGRRDSVVSLSG